MHLLNQSALLNMLGWALFNSLWQMSLMWLLYMIITAGGKKFSSAARHSIALLLLGTGTVWFVLSLIINCFSNSTFEEPLITTNFFSGTQFSFFYSTRQLIAYLLPYCSTAYLLVLCFLVARYLKYYFSSQQLKQTGLHKAPVQLRIFIEDIAERLGISKNVKLWLSSAIQSPMTIGFLKPVILIPFATINHLSTQQMEAVLLHELAHIKRNDYFLNLLVALTEIVFFFNPFSLLLIHSIKKERENSCDDLVIQFRYDSCAYASALLSLERARNNSRQQLAMAAVGKSSKMLLQRVMRITGHKNPARSNKPGLVLFMLIAITAAFSVMVKPQEIVSNLINKMYTSSTTKPYEVQQVSFRNESIADKKKQKKSVRKKNKVAQENINEEKNADENIDFVSSNEEQNDPDNKEAVTAVVSVEPKDYSLAQGDASATVPAVMPSQNSPYVPSTSFSYNEVEDADIPKRSLAQLSKETTDANQALHKAMKAMNAINLKKVAKRTYITRKDINANIGKLQCELQKCMEQLNDDKINKDVADKLNEADEMRLRKDLDVQVQTLQSLNNSNAPKAKQLSRDIMKQQLKLQQADLKKQHELIKKLEQLSKKLKIVYI